MNSPRPSGSVAAALLAAVLGAFALDGCGPLMPRNLRSATYVVQTDQGRRTFEDVSAAVIERPGWRLRVADSTVAAGGSMPYLEKLVLEITNTSSGPLEVRPGRVRLAGLARDIRLSPPETKTVAPGASVQLAYEPGIRAPELPYPFRVTVEVFGPDDVGDKVVLRLR